MSTTAPPWRPSGGPPIGWITSPHRRNRRQRPQGDRQPRHRSHHQRSGSDAWSEPISVRSSPGSTVTAGRTTRLLHVKQSDTSDIRTLDSPGGGGGSDATSVSEVQRRLRTPDGQFFVRSQSRPNCWAIGSRWSSSSRSWRELPAATRHTTVNQRRSFDASHVVVSGQSAAVPDCGRHRSRPGGTCATHAF